jgi:hypothetical protein
MNARHSTIKYSVPSRVNSVGLFSIAQCPIHTLASWSSRTAGW